MRHDATGTLEGHCPCGKVRLQVVPGMLRAGLDHGPGWHGFATPLRKLTAAGVILASADG